MRKINFDRQLRRQLRISSRIFGIKNRPRISIFRSNRYIYSQAIDDERKITIASFSSLKLFKKESKKMKKTEEAKLVGKELAKILKEKGITKAVLDRRRYSYKGRVKQLTEGLREGGINI